MGAGTILIIDDDEALARTLAKSLGLEGYQVVQAHTAATGLRHLEEDPTGFDLALVDLRLPDGDGLDLLPALRAVSQDLPCVVFTAFASVQSAVEAMRRGAFDFLMKPFPREKLLTTIERALERARLVQENRLLKDELARDKGTTAPSTRSPAFAQVLDLLRTVAPTDTTVLLTGETGTGKERAAALVHRLSRRAESPLLTVNCAALASSLLESQLFGHLRGAFSGADEARKGLFEEAAGGTLFLDEIGDVSERLQAKLLRVLQEGEFLPVGATRPRHTDVRIIAATNRNLGDEVLAGRFREDLFYRLNVFAVELPPLRRRLEDLEALARELLAAAARRVGKTITGMHPETLHALQAYPWPGNIRELRNVIERAVILCPGDQLGPELLALTPDAGTRADDGFAWPRETVPLWQVEKAYIAEVLARNRWQKSASARELGISRKTLDRKIREYQLPRDGGTP